MKQNQLVEYIFKAVVAVAAFLIAATFNGAKASFERLNKEVVALQIKVAEIEQRQVSREEIIKLIDERISIYHK